MIRVETSKLLLYVSGALVMLIGLVALLIDIRPDLRINEYGAFVALLAGAAILIGTTYVYYVLPHYQTARRMEMLRRHYMGKPNAELLNINHHMIDTAQAAILQIEIATEFYNKCIMENINVADCMDNITNGKNQLDQVDAKIAKLKKYGNELDKHIHNRVT